MKKFTYTAALVLSLFCAACSDNGAAPVLDPVTSDQAPALSCFDEFAAPAGREKNNYLEGEKIELFNGYKVCRGGAWYYEHQDGTPWDYSEDESF